MRFQQVFCSQCGNNFGPENAGFSSCADHRNIFPRKSFISTYFPKAEQMKLPTEIRDMSYPPSIEVIVRYCAKFCLTGGSTDPEEGPDTWGWHAKDYAKALLSQFGL